MRKGIIIRSRELGVTDDIPNHILYNDNVMTTNAYQYVLLRGSSDVDVYPILVQLRDRDSLLSVPIHDPPPLFVLFLLRQSSLFFQLQTNGRT